MTKEPDEDLIEATIRRVAEAKAARANAGYADDSDGSPAAVPPPPPEHAPAVSAADDADEDRIAATIRRVAEAKAARAVEPRPPVAGIDGDAAPAPAPAPRPIGNPAPMPVREPESVAAAPESPATADGFADAVAELRRELAATRRELQALSERFEATLGPAAGRSAAEERVVEAADDDEWDDTPQLPRIPLGQPPRPAILRDPSPHTATAEHLEPEPETIIDTRPLPKPLPPLHAEPRRGLDLLPRTYRITVEDKRRGVDLVPLHRALLGMDGVRDMSLLSYSNGVAIVAVDMIDELEPQTLEGAITRAMSRGAKVEVHNDTTMVVKLAEE